MSTKTIALEISIYQRLAAHKREGESFSKVIDRLLREAADAHTGADIVRGLQTFSPLEPNEAETFLRAIAENRESETWEA